MRIYAYLTQYEMAVAGINGLVPRMPQSRVAKLIQMYFNYTKYALPFRDTQIKATTKAIYGGLITSSIMLNARMRVYPNGEIVFFHTKPHAEYPIYVADYRYKNRLHMALLTKNKNEVNKYIEEYIESIMPLSEFIEKLDSIRKKGGENLTPTKIRKYMERFEVIILMKVPPEYLYIKLIRKDYMPFLDWLYAHRGIYVRLIKEGRLKPEDYKNFLEVYNRFKNNRPKGVVYV